MFIMFFKDLWEEGLRFIFVKYKWEERRVREYNERLDKLSLDVFNVGKRVTHI